MSDFARQLEGCGELSRQGHEDQGKHFKLVMWDHPLEKVNDLQFTFAVMHAAMRVVQEVDQEGWQAGGFSQE